MGEARKDALMLDFDQKLKLEYRVIAINKAGVGSPSNTVMAVLQREIGFYTEAIYSRVK